MPQIPYLPRLSALSDYLTTQVDYAFHPLHIFALIGILLTLHLTERALDLFFFHFRFAVFAKPASPLAVYKRRGPKPTYALIAGGGGGGGLEVGIAKALIKEGFGVIILSGHGGDEDGSKAANELHETLLETKILANQESESESESESKSEAKSSSPTQSNASDNAALLSEYIKVAPLNAATATPEEMEATLRRLIVDDGLRVSILVNTTAHGATKSTSLAAHSPDEIDTTLACETRFLARLTALMMPVLTHRGAGVDARGMSFGTHRRSLILNVFEQDGDDCSIVQSSAATFRKVFSRRLAKEVAREEETKHIDVLGVVVPPGGGEMGSKKDEEEELGEMVVNKTDGAVGRGWREMYPGWRLHLRVVVMGMLGEERARRWMGKGKKSVKKIEDSKVDGNEVEEE